MAANEALAVVELLQMIILELPICDVLGNRRVSRCWLSTIERSTSIQQALFLKPIDGQESDSSGIHSARANITTVTLGMSCAEILAIPGRKALFQSLFSMNGDEDGALSGYQSIAEDSRLSHPSAS